MIAERAHVSTATVFKHFPTKADIFGAIMGEVFGNDADALPPAPEPGDPRAGLTEIGADYAALLCEPKVRALFRVIIAEVPRFPELGRELYEKGKRPYLVRLKDYVEAEISAGTLQVSDVDLAIRQFLGMINDVVFWPHMLVVDLEESDARTEAVVSGAVEVIVKSYGAKGG
jgi:AcrR family transcriptional regulator